MKDGNAVGLLNRIFGTRQDDTALALYNAVVVDARQPHWYLEGAVPDTVDGRFDMIAAVLTMVLLRLESDDDGATLSARLTERFVTDMDEQLREIGIGDLLVGKHVGAMMAMLGGRIGAYRDGIATDTLDAALERNLYRGTPPDGESVAHVSDALTTLLTRLRALPVSMLAQGVWP